jgi:hypothetical protein
VQWIIEALSPTIKEINQRYTLDIYEGLKTPTSMRGNTETWYIEVWYKCTYFCLLH